MPNMSALEIWSVLTFFMMSAMSALVSAMPSLMACWVGGVKVAEVEGLACADVECGEACHQGNFGGVGGAELEEEVDVGEDGWGWGGDEVGRWAWAS